MTTPQHTYVVALTVLVATFVVLYPYLGAMGFCDHDGECPYVAQSSHTSSAGLTATCLSAVLAASSAGVLAFATFYGRRITSTESQPEDIFLPPDPHPPQLSLN